MIKRKICIDLVTGETWKEKIKVRKNGDSEILPEYYYNGV